MLPEIINIKSSLALAFIAAILILSPLSHPAQGDTIFTRDGTKINNVRARITQKHIIYTDARGKTIRLPLKSVKRIVRKKLKTPKIPKARKSPKIIPVKTVTPESKKVTPLKTVPQTPPPKTKKGRPHLQGFIPGWSGFYSSGQYKYGIIFSVLEIVAGYYVLPWTESVNSARGRTILNSGLNSISSILFTREAWNATNGHWWILRQNMHNKVVKPNYTPTDAEELLPDLMLLSGKVIRKDTYRLRQATYIGGYLLLLTADVLAAWYFGKPAPTRIKKTADQGPRFNLNLLPGKTSGLRMGLTLSF